MSQFSDRPAVALVVSHLTPELGMEKCARRLKDLGPFDLTIICIGEDDDPSEDSVILGSKLSGLDRWRSVPRLRRWAASNTSPVIVVGVWAAVPLLSLCRRSPFPIVVWEHSLSREKVRSSSGLRLLQRAAKKLYKRAAAVVCVSDDLSENVRAITRAARVVTIPNYIDTNPKVPALRATREADRKQLLTVGSLRSVKNHQLLLRAMTTLPPHYRLRVAGDGPMREELQSLAETLGVATRVDWLGHLTDMSAEYAAADIVVQPALGETFGLAMIEAAAAHIPVVAVDYPYARTVVPQLVPGRLAGPDPRAFAEALLSLDRERPSVLDFQTADTTRQRTFSATTIGEQWLSVINDVMRVQ
jgi:glycosyltransferase involved in cell wall biosynthesis